MSLTWAKRVVSLRWSSTRRALYSTTFATALRSKCGSPSSSLDAAVQRSIAAGVTYAIAAGNSGGSACNASPARVPQAITVGATTFSRKRSG